MIITDKMVEAAARAFCRAVGQDPDEQEHIDGSVGVWAPLWLNYQLKLR